MDWATFEKRVYERMELEHIPGLAIAVSKNGKILYEKGYGVQDLETQELVNTNTIFGIASVTKSFTALAISILEAEGKLSIEDPVTKYLPEFSIPTITEMDSIKIHHLLTHSTGLAPLKRREELNKLEEHLDYLAGDDHDILGSPGEYFSYCNDTFLLLGAIIENVTGCLFRRFVTERILTPLKMYRSTFSLEELAKMDNVSTPYVFTDGHYQKQPWPPLGNYEVGGGIRSTVHDLLKYGFIYINQKQDILPTGYIEKMWKPVIQYATNSYYGYALEVTPHYHGVTLVEHGGGQPGVSSNFGFVPEEGLVAVVLTNVSGAPARDIWLEAVNTALGITLEEKRSVEPIAENVSAEELMSYVGTYQSKEGSHLEIRLEDHRLYAIVENDKWPLEVGENQTIVSENGRVIRFYFNKQNKSWAAFFGMRMLLKTE